MSESIDKLKVVASAAAEDMRTATPLQTAAFGATALATVAHEFGMEFTLGNIGARVFEATGNNPLAAGAAMGLASFTVEMALTSGISYNLKHFGRASKAIEDQYYADTDNDEIITDSEIKTSKVVNAIDTVTFAAALGSPGVILREYSKNPNKEFADNMRTGTKTAAALAAANMALGTAITGGVWLSDHLGLHEAPEKAVAVATNPLTYIGLFAFGRVLKYRQTRKERKAKEELILEQNGSSGLTLDVASEEV